MRKILIGIIFWLHAAIVIFWWGLFFFPKSFWPAKISFHFYLTLFIFGQQILWGLLVIPWTKKFRLVCILTTMMQLLRGQKISDPRNYNHLFTKEFLGKAGITINHSVSTILGFTILILVTVQYLFFR